MSAKSPEALRRKRANDEEYEETPERVKYREELNQERRKRGIMGEGGPDMSHTEEGGLVEEDPHTNRARHFASRGTLKGEDPMGLAWRLLKTLVPPMDPLSCRYCGKQFPSEFQRKVHETVVHESGDQPQ